MSFVSSQVSGLFLRAAGLAPSPCSAFKFLVLRVVGEKLSECGLETLKALSAGQKYKYEHSSAFVFKSMIFAHSERGWEKVGGSHESRWLRDVACLETAGVTRTLSGWGNGTEDVWCSVHLEFGVGRISCTKMGKVLEVEFVFLTPKMLWLPSNTERALFFSWFWNNTITSPCLSIFNEMVWKPPELWHEAQVSPCWLCWVGFFFP